MSQFNQSAALRIEHNVDKYTRSLNVNVSFLCLTNLHLAGRLYPAVILASPVLHPLSVSHSSTSSRPAAQCMAPSTPLPPNNLRLAALTMASTSRVVMSPLGNIATFSFKCGSK